MDEGKGNNTNLKFNYGTRPDRNSDNSTSIIESRAKRNLTDSDNLSKDLQQLKKDTTAMINEYRKLPEISKSQQKEMNDLIALAQKLKQTIKDSTDGQVYYTDALNVAEEGAKKLLNTTKKIRDIQMLAADSDKERIEIAYKINDEAEHYEEILDGINDKITTNKKANESLLSSFADGVKNLKNEVAQIATITGLDNIYNSLTGKNGQLSSYNTMRSQFNMSKSDFNTFKRDIYSHIKENGDILKYGFQDALDYMNRLGELGITDVEMAREQMDAIMLSTKYLGMSADTQSKILKQARNTGNMDLLNQTNQTMVKIMNAQLGVSQDQLDAIVNQSASIADLSIMFSGNPNALKSFTMSASAIESVYGESASKAAMNIAADLLNNGGASRYVAVLGENYGDIIQGLQAGNGNALYDILQAVQTSNVSAAGGSGVGGWSSLTGAGILDNNTMALYTAREANGSSYGSKMADILAANDDTNKFLEDMQLDFKTMLENVTSWVSAWLPLDSLQVAYYTLAIADMAFGVGRSAAAINKSMKLQVVPYLKAIAMKKDPGDIEDLFKNPSKGSAIGTTLGYLSIIAGAVMAIGDGVDAMSKADEWGTSKGSAFFGGLIGGTDTDDATRTLKNAMKWALVGAGVGMMVGHPIIGGLLGALFGSVTGAIGGEKIAGFFNGGDAEIPATFGGTGDAMGGLISRENFPWRLTSKFGYRDVINTKAGKTSNYHRGIDLASKQGTPIGANNAGIVSASGTASDGANYVVINSGDGWEQIYYHLKEPSHLLKGQPVLAGQLIGYMGMTGKATGPHLHFGIRKAGTQQYVDPINSVNSELFYPTESGVPNLALMANNENNSTVVMRKVIDADTLSREAGAAVAEGIGSDRVVNSVNGGFAGLIAKLEELSERQDSTEEMLKMIAQGKGSNLYRF